MWGLASRRDCQDLAVGVHRMYTPLRLAERSCASVRTLALETAARNVGGRIGGEGESSDSYGS